MSKIRELTRVSDPEYRSGISNKIPVSFFSIELDCHPFFSNFLPLGSLSVSLAPFSPATVENLMKVGVFFPTPSKSLALVPRDDLRMVFCSSSSRYEKN